MRISLFCIILAVVSVTGQGQDSLINTNVERTLDLLTHLPKETIIVTIENPGPKAIGYYDYYVEPQHVNDVVYVEAVVSKVILLISQRMLFMRTIDHCTTVFYLTEEKSSNLI